MLSTDYLYDGLWHHLAFVKDGHSGDQAIWIDGKSPAPLQLKGNATGRRLATSHLFLLGRGSVTTYVR